MRFNRFILSGIFAGLVAAILVVQTQGLAQTAQELVVHYAEAFPDATGTFYNVNVYLSVLDDSGNLISGLTIDDDPFLVQEDGQKVEIQSIHTAHETPLNIVLVMDTSGSMNGASITDAKAAAANFISGLMKPDDKAAVITFGDEVQTQIDFTSDQKTIIDGINRINASRLAGSCLYDAAIAAIQSFSKISSGNRVIVLFADGPDETPNLSICSTHHIDDVIELASEGETRVPIYTFGLGTKTDAEALKSIAKQTGGLYLYSSDPSQLANTFQLLSNLLSSQYILTYSSVSSSGPHTLTISLDQLGQVIEGTLEFVLPPLPAHITFLAPLDGDIVDKQLKIAISLTTQDETPIDRVVFEINGIVAGSDDTKPYELELDTTGYPTGEMIIIAIAYGANNAEIARSTLKLIRVEATGIPMTAPAENAPNPTMPEPAKTDNSIALMAIILSGLSIVTIAILLVFLLRQQKQARVLEVENYVEGSPISPMQGIPVYPKADENDRPGGPESESDALGALTVEASDDSSMIGHRFEINAPLITLGRSADNDLNFPGDKPVSRHHAEIYLISNKLYLREVEMADSSGTAKPPKYGTFLNQLPMGHDPALLKNGDEIQLGKRVRLKFESYARNIDADMMTFDDGDLTNANDIDKTQAQ